jgi:2,4-dienoyl-CoA reductase-like NADH-dependent reductase (Old Yellow Enzyme family)
MNAFTPQGRVPTETAKEMSLEDIRVTVEDHVHAAKCAIEAGFDAVEIVRLYSLVLFFHLKIPIDKSGC